MQDQTQEAPAEGATVDQAEGREMARNGQPRRRPGSGRQEGDQLAPAMAPHLAPRGWSNLDASDQANIELVFGFVGPSGIDLDKVCDVLKSQLAALQYDCVEVRISGLISDYLGQGSDFNNVYHRLKTLMELGTKLREETQQADIAARLAIFHIRRERQMRSGDANRPAPRTAYLVRSFKRKEEVELSGTCTARPSRSSLSTHQNSGERSS